MEKLVSGTFGKNDWEAMFRDMCHYYLSLIEGDTHMVDDAFKLMRSANIVDEDGFEL